MGLRRHCFSPLNCGAPWGQNAFGADLRASALEGRGLAAQEIVQSFLRTGGQPPTLGGDLPVWKGTGYMQPDGNTCTLKNKFLKNFPQGRKAVLPAFIKKGQQGDLVWSVEATLCSHKVSGGKGLGRSYPVHPWYPSQGL